jgi:LysM repeat protein
MKIKQLDEYKYTPVTKVEKGEGDGANLIRGKTSTSSRLRSAADKLDNPYTVQASTKGTNLPSANDVKKTKDKIDPTSGDPTDKERAEYKAKIDAIRGDSKPAKNATAAIDDIPNIPKKGMFQSDDAYLKSLTSDQLERVLKVRQAKQAANIQNDKNIVDKAKEKPITTAAVATALAGGTAYVTPKVIDNVKSGMAADEKEDELEKQQQSSDTKPATGTDTKPATGDGTISNPSKNSPFYVPSDNDSRENKPYPKDSRYGKEDAAKAAADAAKATSTQSSSGYKGSKGSQAIQALNPEIADVNKIRTGQELKMPDGSTYTVQKGDALDRIARNAGLSPRTAPSEKPAASTAKSKPEAPAEPKVYTGAPASVDTRDGTGDLETDKVSYTDKVPDDVAPVVRTGSGGTLTTRDGTPVTSRSANEIEWQMKNPMQTYPGADAVAKQKEQGEKNWNAIKNFFGGNKEQPKEPETIKVDLDTVDLGTPEGQALRDKVISDIAKTGLAKNNESLDESTLNTIKKLSSITESKITQVDNNMDLRKLLAIMSETKMADLKGKKHGGSYGKEYDTDEEGEDKPAAKKSRGGQESDSTKDSKKWQGADDAADAIIGGKAPKKEVGTKSVKHSIKEWMQAVEQETLQEGAKPDFLDMDKDGDKKEPMKKAVADKKNMKKKTVKEGGEYKGDKPGQSNFKPYSGSPSTPDRERAAMYKKDNIPPELQANNSPAYQNWRKDKDDARIQQRSEQEYKLQTGKDMPKFDEDISEELKGGQKKIDKNKNGKLDSEDFKMLRKNKVDEGVNLHKMMTEKHTKVDEMLEELQREIAEFKTTGEMGDKLRDALDLHTYSKGETLIGEGDQELADKFHDEDMIRLGDEGKADAQHMQDLDRTRDESTADLWRMKDLARDKTMARADAISLREEDHAQGDTVYHRGQIGIVDRIEGNKCFVHKPNGDMDVWPTEECSKKKQGAFDMFKKDVQDVGAGFGRFLKGKSELDESPFAFESKKAKVEEEDQPKLKTKMTDTGTETTSSTGRIKATFEPGKETKVEPVKESMAYERNNMPPKDLDGLERWAAGSSNRRHFSLVAKFGIINDMNLQQTLEVLQNFDDEDYASQYGASEESGNALYNSIALFNAYENVYDAWIPPDFDYNEPESVTWDEDYTGKRAGIKESMAYDVWNHQLEKMINESMINESLTVTTTKGDNGTDDSVSVTASGNDASEIMAILRNAGIGSMGAEEGHTDHPTSAYGAPEGESVGIVKIDGPEVIDGDDTMLGLMKKIADISNGNSEHQGHDSSDDYADENCEQEVDEGNAFTGALKDTPQGGEFEVDGKKYTDTSSLEEGNRMCSECGMNEGECGHKEMVDEDDVEDAKVGIAAGSPAAQAAEPAAPEAGQRPGGVAFNQDAPAAPAAAGPAASNAAMSALTGGASAPNQTAAMPTSQSTAASAPAAPTSNIRSRTPDEIANTGPMGIQKPSAADKAAGDRTLNSIKNFFGGGKPDQAAQDKAGSAIGQGYAQAQAATDKNVQAQNTDVAATAARDQLQKDVNAGKSVASTNVAPSQINPAVLGQQAGATTKATGKVSYAPNAGGVTKTASANPAQKLAAQNKAGSKIGQGYAQAALAEGPDIEFAEVGLEEDAEYANSDDDAALQDIKFMTNYITGGLNGQKTMHRHGYQNGDNPLAMKESTDPLVQWKKLSGLQ